MKLNKQYKDILWPLVGFSAIILYISYMFLNSYSYKDDLVQYFSLHKYINGGFSIHAPECETYTKKCLTIGITIIYVPIMLLFDKAGMEYPLIATSKFLGFILIPLSFLIWYIYLKNYFSHILCLWACLSIVVFNTVNQIIPAGLARSFNVFLLGLWVYALQTYNTIYIVAVLFICSLIYPVLLPVMGLSLFFITMWSWHGIKTVKQRVMTLWFGFIFSVIYPFINYILLPSSNNQVMSLNEMDSIYRSGNFPSSLDMLRNLGRISDQTMVEWFQFNVFNYSGHAPHWIGYIIIVAIMCIILLGLPLKTNTDENQTKTNNSYLLIFSIIIFTALLTWKFGSKFGTAHRGFSWWFTLSSLAWFCTKKKKELPQEMWIILLASIIAFPIILILCTCNLFILLEPGRQLQKSFAIITPVVMILWLKHIFDYLSSFYRVIVLTGSVWVIVLFLFSPWMIDYEYCNEPLMNKLKKLPVNARILAHPKTTNYILVMAGRSTSTAEEMVRIAAKPYTSNILSQYSKDIKILYALKKSIVKRWCREDTLKKYILVEKNNYQPKEIGKLLGYHGLLIQKKRSTAYFLEEIDTSCIEKIDKSSKLISCKCILSQ